MQAAAKDFYFSHRIFFFLKSVFFEGIADPRMQETQREAVDIILKGIYKNVSDKVNWQLGSGIGSGMDSSSQSAKDFGDED